MNHARLGARTSALPGTYTGACTGTYTGTLPRVVPISAAVVVLHVAALWAVHASLQRQVLETVIPTEILIEMVTPAEFMEKVAPAHMEPAQAAPKSVAKSAPSSRSAAVPSQESLPTTSAPASAPTSAQPTPQPDTPASATAAAVSSVVSNGPASATAGATSSPVRQSASTAPTQPAVEQPSSDADYLNNPKPPYPALSKRLGEQGKVIVRALIGVDGSAHSAEIKQSSGFDRLDQAALTTTLRWRYVPGKRGGVPQAMWFHLPFTFVLE